MPFSVNDVINVHINLRQQVINYVYGEPARKLNADDFKSDTTCTLGKWIYSDLSLQHNRELWYTNLVAYHAVFHVVASSIIEHMNQGRVNDARRMCENSLEVSSAKIIEILLDLKLPR